MFEFCDVFDILADMVNISKEIFGSDVFIRGAVARWSQIERISG